MKRKKEDKDIYKEMKNFVNEMRDCDIKFKTLYEQMELKDKTIMIMDNNFFMYNTKNAEKFYCLLKQFNQILDDFIKENKIKIKDIDQHIPRID